MKPMTLSPYLNVDNAAEAIRFYAEVFGAEETFRLIDPNDGRVGHAEMLFGTVTLMVSDEYPDFGALGPNAIGGSPVKLSLTVDDVDETFARALAHGAVSLRNVRDEFHGNRTGQIADPFGHIWFIQSQGAPMSPAEMQARWNETATA